jgi:hypothetical protein
MVPSVFAGAVASASLTHHPAPINLNAIFAKMF